MASSMKRQPKAGELASRGSGRWAEKPRDVVATRPMIPARTEDRAPVDISLHLHKVKYYGAGERTRRDTFDYATWNKRGGMMGGSAGACKAVTSCAGVARAFIGRNG